MDKSHEYIKLSSAHITQHTQDGQKTDWSVEANITNERLFTLPKNVSDINAYAILESARKYELIAWNEGIKFQKSKQNEFLTSQIKELKAIQKALIKENEKLADVLDKQIKKGQKMAVIDLSNYDSLLVQATDGRAGTPDGNV